MRAECPDSRGRILITWQSVGVKHTLKRKHVKTSLSPKCVCVCMWMSYSRTETHFSFRPARGSLGVTSRGATCILENQIKVSRHEVVWRPRVFFPRFAPPFSNVKTGFKVHLMCKYKFINALFINAICGRSNIDDHGFSLDNNLVFQKTRVL